MGSVKPMSRDSFDDYAIVSGVTADTEILPRAGGVGKIQIVTAGHASSYIAVYDGAAVGGTLIAYLSGATIGATIDVDCWCKTSIHVKTVDADATLVVRMSGHLR